MDQNSNELLTSCSLGYGSRLIPCIIDETAQNDPKKLYAVIPNSAKNIAEGFRNMTYRDFANAINGAASWIERTFGRSSDFRALGYIGLNDLRYRIILVAAIKTGHKVS